MSREPATIGGQPYAEFALERFTPGTFGPKSAYEHWSRYLFARPWVAGRDVLDHGCGTGFGSRLLAEVARDVLAVDLAPGAVVYAREHHPHPRCRFECCAALPAALPAASRDVVVCFEVIEHLHPQEELLHEFARILRPGGVLLLSTPDPRYTATLGPNPFHVCELTRDELVALVDRHFPHRQVYVQTPVIGEGLCPEDGAGDGVRASVAVLGYHPARNCWDVMAGTPGPTQTYVVVASDRALPEPLALVVSDRDGRLLDDERRHVAQLVRERADLHEVVRAARDGAAQALDAERERHGRELVAERARAEEAERARAVAETNRCAAERSLGALRLGAAQAEETVRGLRAEVDYLRRKVGLRWVTWALRGAARGVRRRAGGGAA